MLGKRLLTGSFCLCTLLLLSPIASQASPDLGQSASAASSDVVLADVFSMLAEENVIISATKNSQKVADAPAIVSVITARQIEERGYKSVAEAISSLPGLYLASDHVEWNLGVRGFNGGHRTYSRIVKVMIDGQPVAFRSTTDNFLSEAAIPMEVVQRIEVIRGPNSALYGANAFLGVINIVTKEPNSYRLGAAAGRIGLVQGHAAYAGTLVGAHQFDGIGFLAGASYQHTDRSGLPLLAVPGREPFSTELSTNDLSRPLTVFAKLIADLKSAGKLHIDGSYQQVDSFAEFQDWSLMTHQNRLAMGNVYGRAQYQLRPIETLELSAMVAYAQGFVLPQERVRPQSVGAELKSMRKLGTRSVDASAGASWTFKPGDDFKVGVDASFDRQVLPVLLKFYDDRVTESGATATGERNFNNIGAFAQLIMHPFRYLKVDALHDFSLTGNVRYDGNTVYGSAFNGRVAAVLPFAQHYYVKVSFGTSYKAPATAQLYPLQFGLPDVDVVGNPLLKPEKARTVDAQVGCSFFENRLAASVNGFFTDVSDQILYTDYPQPAASNVASARAFGVEAEVTGSYEWLSAYTNFSYQSSTTRRQAYLSLNMIEVPGALYPDAMLKLGATARVTRLYFIASVEGEWIGRRLASDQSAARADPINRVAYPLAPYFLLHVAAASTGVKLFGQSETQLKVKLVNVLDQRYAYPGYGPYDVPALGRQFFVELRQSF